MVELIMFLISIGEYIRRSLYITHITLDSGILGGISIKEHPAPNDHYVSLVKDLFLIKLTLFSQCGNKNY